jgi:hypothetical protein
MDGEIIDRECVYAAIKAAAAEQLAAMAEAKGDAAGAADWKAKAEEAHVKERELYAQSKTFWNSIYDPEAAQSDQDTFAGARSLRIEALELRSQGRFDEAVTSLDQARWMSNEFWNYATDLMLEIKDEAKMPLALTEVKYRERREEEAQYTRHMPRSIAGHQYRFLDGIWNNTEYNGEQLTPVQQGSEEHYKLQYAYPEVGRITKELDGNIILRAGDAWYEYRSNEPAKPSKLNPYNPQ